MGVSIRFASQPHPAAVVQSTRSRNPWYAGGWHTPPMHVAPEAQLTHTEPFEPHAQTLGVTQAPFWQHPLGHGELALQLVGWHAPPLHVSFGWQAMQAAPLAPQAALPGAVTQAPFWQHPLGQLLVLQVGWGESP